MKSNDGFCEKCGTLIAPHKCPKFVPVSKRMITIPVAEYEGLKRRAFTLAELESFLLWGQRTNISPEEWEDDALLAKLTAAIKEQEG